MYTVFDPLQGWRLHHLPGQPGPMPDHSLREDIFPNIQSKPPLTQLEAIASRPVAGYLGEETNSHLTTPFCQGAVESEKVSPQPPLLQTEQPQLPQSLLIRLFSRAITSLVALLWTRSSPSVESQNHRIVGVGRDLCGSSSPTPLPKQGHLQ